MKSQVKIRFAIYVIVYFQLRRRRRRSFNMTFTTITLDVIGIEAFRFMSRPRYTMSKLQFWTYVRLCLSGGLKPGGDRCSSGDDPHSESRFPAPSSRLCHNWIRHWRGTLYLRTSVHRRCQRSPKDLGARKTVDNIASKHACKLRRVRHGWKKEKRKKLASPFNRFWFYLCWC